MPKDPAITTGAAPADSHPAGVASFDDAFARIEEISTLPHIAMRVLEVASDDASSAAELRDIVEAILPPSAYDFQVTLGNGKRVDCLLDLYLGVHRVFRAHAEPRLHVTPETLEVTHRILPYTERIVRKV